MDDFIKHHRINKQLAKQMPESFDHKWKNTKGIDMNSILKAFPECSIQADIIIIIIIIIISPIGFSSVGAGAKGSTNSQALSFFSILQTTVSAPHSSNASLVNDYGLAIIIGSRGRDIYVEVIVSILHTD
ncbi:unnamed protein product [Rotaria magnacalcarata]|uniref:Uncharacterized protein n=1 Tax=Rotaria magnacalcarata TaxID=392030 RepID=A0A815GG69_9BILA|nr:unnamed protein product [Rotaria magnacalcarata]CAF1446797.1 unnamed protein product [Rotaria magnacalcarata]CAF3810396.1 unnamed protein product [Rotaria magnacalcarata]